MIEDFRKIPNTQNRYMNTLKYRKATLFCHLLNKKLN